MPTTVRQRRAELFEKAKAMTTRREDGSFVEEQLEKNLMTLLVIDVDSEKRRKAKAIIDSQCAVGNTEVYGQLCLPEIATYDYEPQRMVRDDEGGIEKQDDCRTAYKFAESSRARENAMGANEWWRRKSVEAELFAKWTMEQERKGRDSRDLTFGNFIRETGLWGPSEDEESESQKPQPLSTNASQG